MPTGTDATTARTSGRGVTAICPATQNAARIATGRKPKRSQIALLGGRVPVVPLAPDVQDATDAAQVLMYAMREGKLGKWALWLTHKDILDGLGRDWYCWPEVREEPKVYNLIYADPPWEFKDKCHAGNRGAGYKYSTMNLSAIKALPVADIAADNAILAMWWVASQPMEALAVVDAWGFKLKTMTGFTWHKTTKNGKDHFGMGNWTRANAENCLFAVRGKPKRVCAGVRQLIVAQVGHHSAKPPEARDRLVRLMGDVPRVELFARERADGWSTWGNQVESDSIWPVVERAEQLELIGG